MVIEPDDSRQWILPSVLGMYNNALLLVSCAVDIDRQNINVSSVFEPGWRRGPVGRASVQTVLVPINLQRHDQPSRGEGSVRDRQFTFTR